MEQDLVAGRPKHLVISQVKLAGKLSGHWSLLTKSKMVGRGRGGESLVPGWVVSQTHRSLSTKA